MFKIELGSKVKDLVSGYTGTVVNRVQYLNRCIQYGVQGKMSKEGKLPDTHYFDEGQLEVVSAGSKKLQAAMEAHRETAPTGGPQNASPPSGPGLVGTPR